MGKPGEEITPQERAAWKAACEKRMARIDALSYEMRLLVHEYGWEPVQILLDLGVTKPRQMEHFIRAIRLLDVGSGILTNKENRKAILNARNPQG